jgi:hypothetical protein
MTTSLQVTSDKHRITSSSHHHIITSFLFSIFLLLLASCARQVLPSGGPKDTTPPVVVGEKPENGSTNFNGKIIKITFDEFVTLNNPTENVIFSPPMDKRVDYTTQGKSVLVKFNDTLQSNTTYNLLFSDCIQDYHEGNKLSGYNFALSTGDSIDNHKLFGKVVNAETNNPEAGVFVMLYEEDIDSLPLTTRPNYLTKTNVQGDFFFHHLKQKNYKIFALKDINSDLKYNLPNELIAFADSTFQARYYETDSLFHTDVEAGITLRLFQEADTVQLLGPYMNSQNGVYRFPYKNPIHSFDLQVESDTTIDFFSRINTTRDTISLYLKTFFKDSAMVYIQTDTVKTDTVELQPYKPPRSTGKAVKPVASKLNINLMNKEDLYAPTLLNFSYPIRPVDSAEMFLIATLFTGKDTTSVFVNIPDDFVMQIPVPFKFEPKINYTLWFRDSLFYGYDGATNDTVMYSFSKKTEKDYGNLIIHYKVDNNYDADFLVELLSSNQKVIFNEVISTSKTVEYKHLLPGTYQIKVVEDRNKNGKWDTGNYRKKEQPEKIFLIEKEINIRGFWDIEEDIELSRKN